MTLRLLFHRIGHVIEAARGANRAQMLLLFLEFRRTEEIEELVAEALGAQEIDEKIARMIQIDQKHAEAMKVAILEEAPVDFELAQQLEHRRGQREQNERDRDREQHDGDLTLFGLIG